MALLGNFDFTELLVIGVGALLIFGRRLPEVAMRAAAQLVRLRRAVTQMWREAGIEEELRRVRREIESEVPSPRDMSHLIGEAPKEPRVPAGEPARAPQDTAEGANEPPTRADETGKAADEEAEDTRQNDRESA